MPSSLPASTTLKKGEAEPGQCCQLPAGTSALAGSSCHSLRYTCPQAASGDQIASPIQPFPERLRPGARLPCGCPLSPSTVTHCLPAVCAALTLGPHLTFAGGSQNMPAWLFSPLPEATLAKLLPWLIQTSSTGPGLAARPRRAPFPARPRMGCTRVLPGRARNSVGII